jgi:hypothetical protein
MGALSRDLAGAIRVLEQTAEQRVPLMIRQGVG